MRNQFLKLQGTSESHNIEIISEALRDYLRSVYSWKREGCSLGPLLCLRVGKIVRNQQKNTKREWPVGQDWELGDWCPGVLAFTPTSV